MSNLIYNETDKIRNQWVTTGRTMAVAGIRGSVTYIHSVENAETGDHWIDVRDRLGRHRSVPVNRVRRVRREARTA